MDKKPWSVSKGCFLVNDCFFFFFNRLTSDASINSTKGSSPPATSASSLLSESLDFKAILAKPHVNENNNLTNSCGILGALRSQSGHDSPISRLSSPSKEDSKDEDGQSAPVDEDDDEEDSRSSESKPSPILSAPTTIRFPARAPEKDRPQGSDSGICRWDKCEASFESVGGLLEHLQVRHRRFFIFEFNLQYRFNLCRKCIRQSIEPCTF